MPYASNTYRILLTVERLATATVPQIPPHLGQLPYLYMQRLRAIVIVPLFSPELGRRKTADQEMDMQPLVTTIDGSRIRSFIAFYIISLRIPDKNSETLNRQTRPLM